jgi:hypothetical protein
MVLAMARQIAPAPLNFSTHTTSENWGYSAGGSRSTHTSKSWNNARSPRYFAALRVSSQPEARVFPVRSQTRHPPPEPAALFDHHLEHRGDENASGQRQPCARSKVDAVRILVKPVPHEKSPGRWPGLFRSAAKSEDQYGIIA